MTHRSISISDLADSSVQRTTARAQPRVAAIIALSAGLGCIVAYLLMTFAPASTNSSAPPESQEMLASAGTPEAEVSGTSPTAEEPPVSLGSVVSDGFQKLIAIGRQTLGLSSPPSTAAAETAPAASSTPPRHKKANSAARSPEIARKTTTDDVANESTPDASVGELLGLEEFSLELLPTVYSDTDARVTPPSFERPQLPTLAPQSVPANEVGVLELLVTEKGEVEKVHLISPANRYRERMLVAAAKAWRFKPATLDGQPVRYRTTVRITL